MEEWDKSVLEDMDPRPPKEHPWWELLAIIGLIIATLAGVAVALWAVDLIT